MKNKMLTGMTFASLMIGVLFAGERVLPVKPGDFLDVDLNTGGSIQIVGSDVMKEAKITWLINGCDEQNRRISAENIGGRIRVLSEYTDHGKQINCSVKINASIPNRMDIKARTRGGSINVSGVEGNISGDTMGGNLGFKEIKGTINMSTKGGSISITDSDADGKVSTMGGSINIKNVAGNIDASTMGGGIYLDNVRQRDKHSISSPVNVSTMGGNIYVANAPYGANTKTMGGNITIEKASKFIQAETMGGNIVIKEHDGRMQVSTKGGNVSAAIVPGNQEQSMDIQSMGGRIELALPAEFSGNFDLEIKCHRIGQERCEIQSDFPIQKRESGEGRSERYVYGTGTTGGGANRVVIRTANGNIVIKKR
jgi:hypothetical protein